MGKVWTGGWRVAGGGRGSAARAGPSHTSLTPSRPPSPPRPMRGELVRAPALLPAQPTPPGAGRALVRKRPHPPALPPSPLHRAQLTRRHPYPPPPLPPEQAPARVVLDFKDEGRGVVRVDLHKHDLTDDGGDVRSGNVLRGLRGGERQGEGGPGPPPATPPPVALLTRRQLPAALRPPSAHRPSPYNYPPFPCCLGAVAGVQGGPGQAEVKAINVDLEDVQVSRRHARARQLGRKRVGAGILLDGFDSGGERGEVRFKPLQAGLVAFERGAACARLVQGVRRVVRLAVVRALQKDGGVRGGVRTDWGAGRWKGGAVRMARAVLRHQRSRALPPIYQPQCPALPPKTSTTTPPPHHHHHIPRAEIDDALHPVQPTQNPLHHVVQLHVL